MAISPEQCQQMLRELLSRRPTEFGTQESVDWFADAAGVVTSFSPNAGVFFTALLPSISDIGARAPIEHRQRNRACQEFIARLRAVYAQLNAELNTYTTAQVQHGDVFTYFEEVRSFLAGATIDVLFVDPYINAEFISRYLPQVGQGVVIRLLTSEARARELKPAVELYVRETAQPVEVRVLPDKSLHDRHLIIDHRDVYQSGASFKDGGRNAPTSINQIVDIASEMIASIEQRWSSATAI